jgi:flap endonuclease-1
LGVDISGILKGTQIDFNDLSGKRIAVDAYNAIYQFLSAIRQPDGRPLSTSDGRPTSHLIGLLTRNIRLLNAGILPVYVFDGPPNEMKLRTLEERRKIKEEAEVKYREALERGDLEAARSYAMQTSRMTDTIVSESMKMLELMGIPHITAPEDGEAQASYMASSGHVWAVASQDYDSLLFGTPRLVRNLTVSGRRKLPGRKEYRDVEIVLYSLRENLESLGITREQLVDIAILVGNDFNEGIRGIGPKKGLALIKKAGRIEATQYFSQIGEDTVNSVRQIFLNPKYTESYELNWRKPRIEELIEFLIDFEFSREHVISLISSLKSSAHMQQSLDRW